METTAEGVETLDELDLVRELGCSHVQGYIFSKPLPRDEADALRRAAPSRRGAAFGPRAAPHHAAQGDAGGAGRRYPATIRNISKMARCSKVCGRADGHGNADRASDDLASGTVRWSRYGRTGVVFAEPVAFDGTGRSPAPACGPQERDGEAPAYRRGKRLDGANGAGHLPSIQQAANGCDLMRGFLPFSRALLIKTFHDRPVQDPQFLYHCPY
jgi:hypothetical protein